MNKAMIFNLININIQQYFIDTSYYCIPHTIRKYKLFIISGFNLKEKKTHICCYALIPDERKETFLEIFKKELNQGNGNTIHIFHNYLLN